MKVCVICIFVAIYMISCSPPTDRYDIERYGFDLQFSKKYRDAGYELIDLVMKNTPDSGDRLFLILNKPLDETALSLYDRRGTIFRKIEVGPGQLVQNKIQGFEKSSYQYSVLLDAMDPQLIFMMTIGE